MAKALSAKGSRTAAGAADTVDDRWLSSLPDKRYFTIGEASSLCGVQQHVLRYWEEEFPKLRPQRRNNRRYYQRADLILVHQIQRLLHEEGYTVSGARNLLGSERSRSDASLRRELLRGLIEELEQLRSLLG